MEDVGDDSSTYSSDEFEGTAAAAPDDALNSSSPVSQPAATADADAAAAIAVTTSPAVVKGPDKAAANGAGPGAELPRVPVMQAMKVMAIDESQVCVRGMYL